MKRTAPVLAICLATVGLAASQVASPSSRVIDPHEHRAAGRAGRKVAQALVPLSQVVYDIRTQTSDPTQMPEPKVTELERARVQSAARQAAAQALWTKALPTKAGDTRMQHCTGTDFKITGIAAGAFTDKGKAQTAYLYTYCLNSTGDFQGLVVLEAGNVAAHYVFVDQMYSMSALQDINRNGFTELVLSGRYTEQGYTEEWVRIAELGPQPPLIGRLGDDRTPAPYSDYCGVVRTNDGMWRSLVLRVKPGPTPIFTQQAIAGECGHTKVATSTGPVRSLTLNPAPTGWLSGPLK